MNVVFVEPAFPPTQRHFVRALAEVGATVIGIGERPAEWLDDELRSWMSHYHQVSTVVDAGVLTDAVRWIQDKLWVDRLEATIEAHTMAAAQVRENCTIPGTSVRTAWLCRDKPSMKEVLRAAGVPTAASAAVTTAAEVHGVRRRQSGYPLILKPRTGAGALDTIRVDDAGQLERPWAGSAARASSRSPSRSSSRGTRASTTRCPSTGDVALDFVSHYYPNVLEAMRTRWISPAVRLDQPGRLGGRLPGAARPGRTGSTPRSGIGTTATHMEWFFGPKGLRFSEIGCRPPGVGAWDLYSAGNDIDLYREWANAIVHGHVGARPSRRFATGIVALRPDRDGHITRLLRASTRSRPGSASG